MSKQITKKLEKAYKELEAADPSNTKKYVKWMKKQAEAGAIPADIIPTVKYFHQHNQRFQEKDIFKYKTLKELEDLVKDIELSPSNRKKRKDAKANAVQIYKDNRWLVNRIDDKEASAFYGRDTRWCITMQDAAYFEDYQKQNHIFYFIEDMKAEKKSSLSKVAYVFKRNKKNEIERRQTFDSQDHDLNITDLNKIFKDIPQNIIDKIEEDIKTVPKPFLARLIDNYDIPDDLPEEEKAKLAEVTPEECIIQYNKHEAIRLEKGEDAENAIVALLLEKAPFPEEFIDKIIEEEIEKENRKNKKTETT